MGKANLKTLIRQHYQNVKIKYKNEKLEGKVKK